VPGLGCCVPHTRSIAHTRAPLPVRYAIRVPCASYREGCLYTHARAPLSVRYAIYMRCVICHTGGCVSVYTHFPPCKIRHTGWVLLWKRSLARSLARSPGRVDGAIEVLRGRRPLPVKGYTIPDTILYMIYPLPGRTDARSKPASVGLCQ
jgi:hypothetical protein